MAAKADHVSRLSRADIRKLVNEVAKQVSLGAPVTIDTVKYVCESLDMPIPVKLSFYERKRYHAVI